MNLRLLFVTLALCLLVGCAHSRNGGSNANDSPPIDFDALASNAKRDLAPRTLPNGRTYCMELAKTERAQDTCSGDLEDGFGAAETDKAVGLANILRGIERIKLSLVPCGFFANVFRLDRCRVAELPK